MVARRDGRFLHYSANFPRMTALLGYLGEHCCSLGNVCDPDCVPPRATLARRKRSAADSCKSASAGSR